MDCDVHIIYCHPLKEDTQTAAIITPTTTKTTEFTESLDNQEKHRTYTVTHTPEAKPIQEQTNDEKPVFITTFKSVQNEDGETVIETENKKVTQEEGVLVEEVLSDTETAKEQDEESSPSKIEIVEVNDLTEHDTKPYTITEPDDVVSEDTIQTEHTETPKQKTKTKKPTTTKFNVIEEQPEEQQQQPATVEYLPEEVLEVELPTAEGQDDEDKPTQITKIKKRKIKKKIGDQEQTIEVITTQKPGQEEEVTVVVTEDDKPEETPDWKVKVTDSVVKKPKDKPKKKLTKKKLKKDELDEYIQFLIHQEIPKTVLQDYKRIEIDQPQKGRRDSSIKELKPIKLIPMKIKHIEVKKSNKVEISSVAAFPQMLKLKTPKQKPEHPKSKKTVPFKTKLKSWINFVPYSPYNFQLTITNLDTKRGQGELSRNVEEALLVLKKRHKKFKPSEYTPVELEEPTLLEEEEIPMDESEKPEKKYKRPKKTKKEDEPEERKLKIGKGKIPQTVEEGEQVVLKPFTIDQPTDSQLDEQPKSKEEGKKKKKPKKPQDKETLIKFQPQDIEQPESDTESVTKVVEVIEYQPEIVEEQQPEENDQKKPKTKKKRKILQKTESSENIIEIIEIPSDKPDEEEKLYEIIVTSTQADEPEIVQPIVTKKKKKIAKLKPQELEQFVAELQEQPIHTIEDNFYEISVTELQPTETEEKEETHKKVKTRKLRHKKGNQEQLIEIIEAPTQEGEEPVYEVLITELEGSVTDNETPEILDKKKKKQKKMKKHELDSYIQQLIEAEIPKTELETYEKIEFGQRPKRAKKTKPKPKKEQPLEVEQHEISISEVEPIEEKPVQKKSKMRPKPQKPQEVPPQEQTYEELQVQLTETAPEEQEKPQQDMEHVQVVELETSKKLDDFDVVVKEITEQTETLKETTKDGEVKEKTKTKRKIKKKVGDKEYEVIIIEEQTEKQPEVEVTVITTEISPDQSVGSGVEEKPRKSKKVKKTVKQDDLDNYLVRVINETPEKIGDIQIVEDIQLQEKVQPDEVDGSIYSVKTTVEEAADVEELKPDKKEEITEVLDTKKSKPAKTKKVKVRETTDTKVNDEPQEISVTDTEDQPSEMPLENDFKVDVTEEEPKQKPKKRVTKPKREEDTVKEYSIVIQELEPETITQEVIDETGVEVKQTVTKRKLKKKEGNKEYLIEIVESFVENKPESEVEIKTTEITPEQLSEEVNPEPITVKKFKKKKSIRDDHDAYIQQLIEQEIPMTVLEQYEPTEIESKPKKKPKRIKKQHKKATEIVDGVAITVHEFDIEEVAPEESDDEIYSFEMIEEETPTEKPMPKSFEIGFNEEQLVEEKKEITELKPKSKKVKKSVVEEIAEKPVLVEEIEQTTEIVEQKDESGEKKKKTVTKRKIKTKSGPEEKVFEISETTHEDQPNAEIIISEVTADVVHPEDTGEMPQTKKSVKKSKKVPKEEIQNFVINVLEEYVTPSVYEDEVKSVPVEEVEKTTVTEEHPTATGEVKKKTVTKRKVKTKSGPDEKVFEIVEIVQEDQPDAEVTVVEITKDVPEELEKPKEKKALKKTKNVPKGQAHEFIIKIIEDYVKPDEPRDEEEQAIIVKQINEKPLLVEEIDKITEIVEEQDEAGKIKPKTITKRKVKTKVGPTEKVFEISEVMEEDKPVSEVTIFEITETEGVSESVEEPKQKKIVKKPKQVAKEQLNDYLVNIIEEYVEREEEKPEDLPISVVEIDKKEEIVDVLDEEGKIKKQKVTKRKIKKQVGPKEEVIEIIETQREDQAIADITVTTTESEEAKGEDTSKKEKTTKPKKIKKVKKDELEDYIMKLIEQDIPKTELEKYEKIEIDEPIKLKKKPIKKVLQKPEKPQKQPKQKYEEEPEQEIRVLESQPEAEEIVFPVHVEELEPQEEEIQVTDKQGDVKIQKVIKRKIKKQVGPKQEIIEIVETQKDDLPVAEITVTTLEPDGIEEYPSEKKVKKPKKTKKVTKDELQDYIQKLIEEDIPKTELETYEKIDIEQPVKLKKKPSQKITKVELKPEILDKPEHEEFIIEQTEQKERESPEEVYEISLHDEQQVPILEKGDEITVQEDKNIKKVKKPKHKIKLVEEQPQKQEESLPDHEIQVTETEPTDKREVDYEAKVTEEEIKSTPGPKKPKEKKQKPETKETNEIEDLKVTIKESSPVPKELESYKVEVIESQTETKENINEDGVIEKQTITKRKVKRQQGPKEDIIEIIEVKTDDQPEVEVTVLETQAEEEKPDETKPVKKKTKKIKKDDLHDYIQKLIEEDIPKTELEKYEKIEFESKPKDTKETLYTVESREEQPTAPEDEKPKKKPKSKKPKENEEEQKIAEIRVVEEVPKEEPLPVVEILESKPVAVEVEEVVDEQGKSKQKTTKKRAFTKKIDNEDNTTIHVVTIHEEDSPEVTIVIEEEQVEQPATIDETDKVVTEKPTVKKPKKTVKKVKKDQVDDYIQKLIDEEIPKTTLEQYEKVEMPDKTDTKPTKPTEQLEQPRKDKKKSPKATKIKVAEEQPDHTETPDTIHEIKITEAYTEPQEQIEEQPQQEHKPEDTEQITPDSHKVTTTEDTKETKPTKHKIKPKKQTSEEPIVHKDYRINVIEEEAEEKEDDEEIPEVVTIEEHSEEAEESHPVDVVEEEVEASEVAEETVEDTTKPKKIKKKVVKKKTDDHDAVIQKLLEQEIEKTELEKYEKVEIDKPKKVKTEEPKLQPIKIERKEQKPKKVVIVDATEVPQMVKLKPSKQKEKPTQEQTVQLPKFKLKSRMVVVEYPPELLKPVITEIGALKSTGDLSRNIEEAEALLKFKPYKPKKIKKPKDDLKKVELEKYEKYISSEEEPEEKVPYKKPEKPSKPEEKQEEVQIKLGKGKKKPKEEEQPESVTLKKIPQKPQPVEEVTEDKTVKTHKVTVKEEDAKPEEPIYEMKPLEPLDFEDTEYSKEEPDLIEYPEELKKDKKEPKQKHKPKSKPKPEQEINITEIVPGEAKTEEEQPEDTVKFRIPESQPAEEPKAERKLKPVKKTKEEPQVEDMVKLVEEEEESKQKSPSPVPQVEEKLTKKPKSKKEQKLEKPAIEEKPDEQFEVSVLEEVIEKDTPAEETVDKVKIKKKVPKKEQSVEEVKVTEEAPENLPQEEIPIEYKITTTVIEPEEAPEEHKVRVVDIDAKEVTVEEVIEEKIVTRKKKPKATVPEEYEFTVQEPEQLQPSKVEETTEEATVKLHKPEEPTSEDVTVSEIITQPIIEETGEEVIIKKKKPKKKSIEPVAAVEVEEERPEEQAIEEILTEESTEEVISVEKPKDYKFSITETEAIEKLVEEVKKTEEIPKPELKPEKPAEVFPSYEIKTVEFEAEKPVTVEEEQPEEVKFAIKPKKVEEIPEEFEVSVDLTEPKQIEETEVETVVKTKKTKKPKKPVEEVAQLEVQVVDTIEKEIVEDIIEELPKVEEVVIERPKEELPDEYKIKISEEQDIPEEETPIAQFVIKPKRVEEKPTEEPEAEFVLKESKPVEEVTEEAEIKTKRIKKKSKEEVADQLQVKVIEEIPVEKPVQIVEEIKEIEEVPTEEVLQESPKDYEFKLEEFEIPKEDIEEVEEQEIKLQRKKKPNFKVTEEPEEEVVFATKKPVEDVEETKIIRKKPKQKIPEEEQAELKVTITEEIPLETELVQEIEEVEEIVEEPKPQEIAKEKSKIYEISVRDIEPEKVEEIPEEEIKLKKKPKSVQPEVSEEPEVEISFKPELEKQVIPEETAIIKKKSKPKVKEEPEDELKIQVREEVSPEKEIQVVEEVEEILEVPKEEIEEVVFKPKKPKKKEEVIEEDVTLKQPTIQKEEEQVVDVILKPKKAPEPQEQDVQVELKLPKEEQITQETSEETIQLKKKKKPVKPTEEAADELVIKQEAIIEKPVEIEEEIIEEAVVMRRKPKKPFEPQYEEHDEEEFSLSIKQPRKINEGVAEETTILQKRPKKPLTSDEAAAELHIKREEEYDHEEEEIEEFVVAQRPKPKPKPVQVTEEDEQEYTVKKLKRRKKDVEIPEFTDVENVTFRPKLTKTKEDVDQEFSIALDSYAEEEVSMSGKVKVKKPIKKTYSEAEDEHRIKIMQDYDDGQGPIIEEIHDDSSIEDTMYDVEEPEEYQIEELPPDDVDFTLKPKHKPKPRYSIQNEEEEQFLIGIRRPKSDSVAYDEDSLTFKKKRKIIQQVFNEDGASLNITREMNIEEADEENVMYSICNYVADSDEAINLVEGEKVHVVGRHSSEWWFVKKTITEEEGWVPAQYLMEADEYNQYVQKKLHEKIDKLPVFERPGLNEKPMAPRFIEKLQPIHTPDGYTVQFECKVEGIPRPQIAWFRETAIIKPSQDFQMYYDDDNVATLIISEVFPEDAGRFTCVAKNAAGFTSTTTELVVETPLSDHGSDGTAMSRKSMSRESSLADILEGIPPTFARKPKAQYVDEDSNVILECRLVAVPEPDIIWTFNGEEIDTTTLKNVRVVTESDMHMYCSVVHIKKVKKFQEGTYEVIATNREGESRLPIVLKVRTNDKEPPQILEPLRNMIIREGESAVLSTQIIGNPAPKITWYKDGKPIKGSTKTEKDIHSLTLISPKRDQKGEYTVKAENPLGSVETSANLTIEEPPGGNAEPPLFVERFEEQNVPQKGVIRLPAKVTGNPVPEVVWLFNNNLLHPNERIQQIYDGENIELIIKDANPDSDSGDYKCIASNPLGKTSHGARVIVEVDEVVFTKKLKSKITIEEIQFLTLECETSHVVSTKWFFNDKELSGMDHRVVVEEGKTHKLVIKNTNLRDSGNYTCKVKDQETKSTVEVLPRKPEFIKPLEDYEVTEKDTAILDVEVSTDVSEMQWFKDGEKITPEKKNIDSIKDGKVHRLLIRNCTIHDEGEYSCKFADQVCKAELTVIELPPEIVKPLEDATVTEGETATFTVELDKGDALIKWFKNGKEINFDEHIQLIIDGKRQSISIKKTKNSDAAVYSLKVGEQTSTAKLVVEKPLVEFVVPLPDVTLATKNTDAEFTVKLSKPDVEVTWFKKGKPVKPDTKHEVFVEGTVRRLVIHNAEDDDAGEVTCTAANVTTGTNLCVEEAKTAPIIISDKEQTIKVKENEDVTMTIKYTGVPQPDAEWKTTKTVIVKSNRIIPTIDEQSASLTIRKVVEEDEDEYTIKLRNPAGEAEANLHLIIMRKPSAPGAPQPLEVMHDSLTLFWKAPEDDGKSDILEYILEYKDIKTEKWTEIRNIKGTTFTLSKLVIDSEYVFRTIAVNEVGPSPPSPLSPPVRLVAEVKKEKPTVQEPLQDISTEYAKDITLSCVFGGVPEPKVVWKKNGKVIQTKTMRYENRVAKYTIEKTALEDEAQYTCVAENEIGSVETICRVTLLEKPSIDIEEKYLSQKLRSGSDMTIPALVKAYPQPNITWYKETVILKTTKQHTIEINEITTTETKTTLNIQKLKREDSGRYKIVAENAAGSSSVECNINVIDKPSRPQTLEIKDIKKDSIKLEWTPPIDDGGLEINKYVLEKCEVQKNVWMKVADFEKDIHSYAIQKLCMNSQYMFRVVAINPIGESEPTESETVTITKKFNKPTPPRAPIDVSGMNDTSFTLSWQESENDGGSKIIEYIVEIKEFHETEYRLLGSTNGNVPNILVTNVIKNKAYTFRIYAKNEVGTSEALETEDKIVVSRRITPPSPPQNLRCPDVTGRSVTLDWEIPVHNGGSEITGYCIEKRSSTSTTWTKVITLDAHCLQYTVDNLKEKSEYWFRVSAENEAGLGAPAVTESIALKTHATVPSPPTAPLEARVIAANAHVFEWGIPESDGGAPLLGYHIAIRDMKKSMWIEVGRVPAGVQKFQIRDLQENHEYMIRIFAKNEIGLSEPLESEEPYKAVTLGHEILPDEPRTEMSTCNTSSWLRDHHMDADIHSYARGKLLRRDEYFFRIWAKMPKKKKNSK